MNRQIVQDLTGRSLIAALLLVGTVCVEWASAGGNNDDLDINGFEASPIPGDILATARGIRWDDRCVPVSYRVNTTQFPLTNHGTVPPLDQAAAVQALERAFATWTEIPTSYIEMRIVGTTGSTDPIGFDFVNEVSFVPGSYNILGVSPSVVLLADTDLLNGEDLDGDGDPDVADGIDNCVDADGDGDIEFPSGFYRAGSMLDNDVFLNPLASWTIDGSALDVAFDVVGIAVHEFGHSHGLAHSGIVQKSSRDGTAATMYNDYRDPIDALAQRVLYSDDIAWSSYLYPEGSSRSGPGRLQKGDVPFSKKYSVISGNVLNSQDLPIAGPVVFAEDYQGNVVASSIAGHVRVSLNPALYQPSSTAGISLLPPSLGVLDGHFDLPVPKGVYKLGIEANDLAPEPTLATFPGLVGYLYGSQNFVEEYYNGRRESSSEVRLGEATPVVAWTDRDGIDFRIDDNVQVPDVSAIYTNTAFAIGPHGLLAAVRVPLEQVLAVDNGSGILIQAATFGTWPLLSSEIATFTSAMITTGALSEDGSVTVDLAHPLVKKAPFVGQDLDSTPLYVDFPRALGSYVKHWLPRYGRDIFLVLEFPPDEYPGYPGVSRYGLLEVVGQSGATGFRVSYYSYDLGATWLQAAQGDVLESAFALVVAPLPAHH